MNLVTLVPEGQILLTLAHGQHTYGELKFESGLSDRWLTIKLKELIEKGAIAKNGRWYRLSGEVETSGYELSLYLKYQTERIAKELENLPAVRMVVLFGSVAQTKAQAYSDLDLLIVVAGSVEKAKKSVISKISNLESIFHLTIEPLILSEQDFLNNLRSTEGGLIFGIADGYEIFLDKSHELSELLNNRVHEIRGTYVHINEEGIWVKAK